MRKFAYKLIDIAFGALCFAVVAALVLNAIAYWGRYFGLWQTVPAIGDGAMGSVYMVAALAVSQWTRRLSAPPKRTR